MKNILIIGNSHVGCLKSGFDHWKPPKTLSFTYIALPGKRFRGFRISNNCLTYPKDDNEDITRWFGIESYPVLDHFDKILYVEGPCRLSLNLYSNDRTAPLLSRSVTKNIVHNMTQPLFNSLVNAISPSKIVYLGSPLISSSSDESQYLKRVALLSNNNLKDFISLAKKIRKVCRDSEVDASLPTIILLPPHLLEEHQFNTLDSYIRGGIVVDGKPSKAKPDNLNMSHANSEYGKALASCLINFFETY